MNITSSLGSIEQNRGGGYYGYRESKAGLNMFTRSIAAELGPETFTCIALSPGWVQTRMGGPNAQLTPEQYEVARAKGTERTIQEEDQAEGRMNRFQADPKRMPPGMPRNKTWTGSMGSGAGRPRKVIDRGEVKARHADAPGDPPLDERDRGFDLREDGVIGGVGRGLGGRRERDRGRDLHIPIVARTPRGIGPWDRSARSTAPQSCAVAAPATR